jgi:hypothetical protein
MNKLKGSNDTVWILGTSESLTDTPWDRKNEDYWCCWPVVSQPCAQGHRIDVAFELHDEKTWQEYKQSIVDFNEKNQKSIVLMQRIYPGLEFAKVFPLEKLQDSINNKLLKRYFSSTIAYMIALAIYVGYKKINLCGINLATEEEEYSLQLACACAWVGYGVGKGVEINITQPSAILKLPYMYGYEGHKDTMIKIIKMKDSITLGYNQLAEKQRQITEELSEQRGALRMLEMLSREFKS